MKKLPIKDWAIDDRPREKLLAKGVGSLSDAEIIAILIGSGNRNETAVELSKRILSSADNNLSQFSRLNINDLTKFNGIGEAKAISIVAAMELGKRRKISEILQKPKITDSRDVFEIFSNIIGDVPYEEFWVLFLNRSNKIIDKQKISQGGVHGTTADIKLILKNAIEKLASGIILCHNHPSGNLMPSKLDVEITNKVAKAAEYIDTQLLDHVIVSDKEYFSFADKGMLVHNAF